MSQDVIGQLCAVLFRAISELSGYKQPHGLPVIHLVSQDEVARIACSGPCAAKAVFIQGDGVYLDDSLDLEHDAFARSVLVHELVHFIQEAQGRFSNLSPCAAWNAREREAYMIQNAYLEFNKTGTHVANSRIAECSKLS